MFFSIGTEHLATPFWWCGCPFQWNDGLFCSDCEKQWCHLTVEWPYSQLTKGTALPIELYIICTGYINLS